MNSNNDYSRIVVRLKLGMKQEVVLSLATGLSIVFY